MSADPPRWCYALSAACVAVLCVDGLTRLGVPVWVAFAAVLPPVFLLLVGWSLARISDKVPPRPDVPPRGEGR
jgi:hypothetical protein